MDALQELTRDHVLDPSRSYLVYEPAGAERYATPQWGVGLWMPRDEQFEIGDGYYVPWVDGVRVFLLPDVLPEGT